MVKTRICKDSLITFTAFKIRNLDVKARKKKVITTQSFINISSLMNHSSVYGEILVLWSTDFMFSWNMGVYVNNGGAFSGKI